MRKARKIFYITATVLTVAAVLTWIFAIRDQPGDSYREINGFVLDGSQPHNIDLDKILADGTGREGVPVISQPKFVTLANAPTSDDTPGVLVEHNGEQHFYPYNIIAWHQAVNDYLGAVPVLVTYSPQCDEAASYIRSANNQSIWFSLSGLSYNSVPLLYDDATNSLWLQNTGQAVVGPRIGLQMERLETEVLTWKDAKQKYPAALALSSETGFNRDYQASNYPGKNNTESIEDECPRDMLQ